MAQQPEKRENSVLFSLRELKQIEEKRVAEEEQHARDQEMAAVRAKEDEERRRREAEEARIRAQQDEERRIRDAAEQRAREDAMRLQEAEARARQEAQAALDGHRLQQELEIRRTEANKKRPIKLIALAAAVLVGVAGFAVYKMSEKADQSDAAAIEAARKQKEAEVASEKLREEVTAMQLEIAEGQKSIDDAQAVLDKADTAEKRAAANAKLAVLRQAQADRAERLRAIEERQRKENRKVKLGNKGGCDPVANPLGC
jgi:hypothetical protein